MSTALSAEERALRDDLIFGLYKKGWGAKDIVHQMWMVYAMTVTVSIVQNAIRNRKAKIRKELALNGKEHA